MAHVDHGDGSTESTRCRAITANGDRCSRPGRDDGFCYQHDESDTTIDEIETDGGAQAEAAEEEDAENEEDAEDGEAENDDSRDLDDGDDESADETESESEEDDGEETSDDEEDDGRTISSEGDGTVGLVDVRDEVRATAEELIGRELDGVIVVERSDDDGWRAEVEVIERNSIPDTQDILGRYEVVLDEEAAVQRYGRIRRYRRDDTYSEVDEDR